MCEEFETFLTQIESCLNSRPLMPISNDRNDLSALTPGHFIIGRPLTSIPEPNYIDLNNSYLTLWQQIQKLLQEFWKRWDKKYLTRLQQRTKWLLPTKNFQVNDLCFIKDDNLPPTKWKMGRARAAGCIFGTESKASSNGPDRLLSIAFRWRLAGLEGRAQPLDDPFIDIESKQVTSALFTASRHVHGHQDIVCRTRNHLKRRHCATPVSDLAVRHTRVTVSLCDALSRNAEEMVTVLIVHAASNISASYGRILGVEKTCLVPD
ncbi:integrase catalytic domain-containing protein [Trichonephila clavipes]|nr:integrase catalytic domain-containing protein [Trichonephila clavipes]